MKDYAMQFGNLSIEVLETGDFALDGGAMFGVVPKNLWEKAYHAPDEQNRIPMKARCLLVRGIFDGRERIILVDTGNGTKIPPKLAQIYKIDATRFQLESSLARFAVTASDVTDVILTHLHFDHAGGATTFDETGKPVPTFPNARYHVQREQCDWAYAPADKDRASFMVADYDPLRADGMLHFTEGEGELFKGIHVAPLYGHTKAMQSVRITSDAGVIYFGADLFPTSAHIAVPFVMGYDNFPLTTIDEKKGILPRASEENWTVVFEHDGFTQASKIVRTEKGFARGEVVTITEW
jgi:glyoxylase-like metal-dependent hydrolase (beta-lactamase superfamily II)